MEAENSLNKVKEGISQVADSLAAQFDDKEGLGRKLLIAGGLFVAGYAISRLFTDNEEDERSEEKSSHKSSSSSMIMNSLKGAATAAVLAYIQSASSRFIEGFTQGTDEDTASA